PPGDAADNGTGAPTESAVTSLSASGAPDAILFPDTTLVRSTALTLSGSAAETVTGLVGDIGAGGLSGALTVTTGDAVDNGISISTGAAATAISASGESEFITVTATALGQNTALTLSGRAAVT